MARYMLDTDTCSYIIARTAPLRCAQRASFTRGDSQVRAHAR